MLILGWVQRFQIKPLSFRACQKNLERNSKKRNTVAQQQMLV